MVPSKDLLSSLCIFFFSLISSPFGCAWPDPKFIISSLSFLILKNGREEDIMVDKS